ncbi:MAG: FlgD immunoglobulin-like domain containing protein [bacterium]
MQFQTLNRALAALMLLPATVLLSGEKIKATAVPKTTQITSGQIIEVPVGLDLTGFPELLGSYTATLTWNPVVLQFVEYTGGHTQGFEKPVVNQTKAAEGKLIVAHAQPDGAEGAVNLLNVKFKVVGKSGAVSELSLHFSAMAAARTFNDLLPHLEQEATEVKALEVVAIPEVYALEQNYPNPFNAGTLIKFALPQESDVELAIYDLLGKKIQTLVFGKQAAGYHVINWDGKDKAGHLVSSGVYMFHLEAGEFKATRKMLFVK